MIKLYIILQALETISKLEKENAEIIVEVKSFIQIS